MNGSPKGPAATPPARPSIYTIALGADFDRLRPEIRAYFTGSGSADLVGVGRGEFERAGSRKAWLSAIMRPLVGAGVFLPRVQSSVPFRIVNRPGWSRKGSPSLRAERILEFSGGEAVFRDICEVTKEGLLRDRLGDKGRFEIMLRCSVDDRGGMVMTSEGCRVRLGRLRIPLPAFLGVSLRGEDFWDDASGKQRVNVRGWNPILGTLIEYRGWFTYEYAAADQVPEG